MSIIEFFSQPLWHRLGLTLTHFLWQGLVVAVLASALVRLFRLRAGNTRYCVYLLAFVVVAICPVITFTMIEASVEPPVRTLMTGADPRADLGAFSPPVRPLREAPMEREAFIAGKSTLDTTQSSIPLRQRVYSALESSLPWAIAGWMIGVVLLSGRLLLGFVGVWRWRRHLKPLPKDLAQRVASLGERLGMKGFSSVFISPSALQAMAVGYLRPLILLPASMVTRMQPEMLEAVIAHELAHIRRFDLWVNLAQRVIETLLFYHPAVWWLSSQLRSEREFCCDELAITATGERLTYASALEGAGRARFEAEHPALSLAFGQRRNSTLGRVRHVLGLPPAPPDSRFWLAGVIAVVVLVVLAMPITSALTARAEAETGHQPLHEAAAAGDIARVRSLIAQGVNLNAKDNEGRTPLFYAVENGHSLLCDLLIVKGADVNVKDEAGDTPLHHVARLVRHNDFRLAAELARRGADVNATNNQRQTPLHVALEGGSAHHIPFRLLRYDVNVNAKDVNGKTALHLAAQRAAESPEWGRVNVLSRICAKGADVNLTDSKGQAALHIACDYEGQVAIRTILRRATAVNVNVVDRNNVTPLHIAARRGQTDICKTLINSGAAVNLRDEHGHTSVHHAVRAGNIETADWLIKQGADMSPVYLAAYRGNPSRIKTLLAGGASASEKDETGFTALHAAAAGGHRDVVEYLISQGADVKAEGGPGWTALSYAARGNAKEVVELLRAKGVGGGREVSRLLPVVIERGYREMVTILVALGADIDVNNGEPLTTAVRCGHNEIVELLISKGADVNAGEEVRVPLYTAAHLGRIDIAERLIDAGANINGLDTRNQGWPLEAAVDSEDMKMIEFLLSKGADVNKGGGWSPLHHAVHVWNSDIVALLVRHGADIDQGDKWSSLGLAAWYVPEFVGLLIDSGGNVNAVAPKWGWTPLHWSAYGGTRGAFDLLVSRGADVNARTHEEETVLHLLVRWGEDSDYVKFVLSRGVNINAADACGWTALHRAVLYNRPEIVEFLIAEGADVNLKDSDGRTALFLSKERGQTEIAELLEKHGAKD
ncbi:MAG: ankyrin repeat domain-containing protein [Planctomycetota bacterium]|jgi:ankyrin repeat protein